jgi:hypothetical protein
MTTPSERNEIKAVTINPLVRDQKSVVQAIKDGALRRLAKAISSRGVNNG